MSVAFACPCGVALQLKDQFAGKLVKCPQCGREGRTGGGAAAPVTAQTSPVFDRDIFLMRQQLFRISSKYEVGDENGKLIVFVVRPAHFLRNLAATFLALIVMIVLAVVLGGGAAMIGEPYGAVAVMLAIVLAVAGGVVVGIALSAKRHVTFYSDQTQKEKLLDVLQDRKYMPIEMTFTVRDAAGRPIARFGKNIFTNVLRRRWKVFDITGQLAHVAKEDSIILSLLRRLIGPLFGLLRTNFIIVRPDSDQVIGEFKRKFTILDRYVLDMSADPQRKMDRRVALALGVMLDTGERR